MKAVMKSVSPRICEKVANGDCTILVSKTAPKCEEPFKCYIYCTSAKPYLYKEANPPFELFFDSELYKGKGYDDRLFSSKVIGEFVCDKVFLLHPYTYDRGSADLERRKFIQTFEGSSKENEILAATCLTQDEMFDYIGAGNYGYGWHISDLKIYGKPKELSEFYRPCSYSGICYSCNRFRPNGTPNDKPNDFCDGEITRPPQSWFYVES